MPEGDWYCKECAAKKNPGILNIPKTTANQLVLPLLKQLARTSPRVFMLPAELHATATAERAARIAEHHKKDAIVTCNICTVDGACDELLNCAMCRHSYHTYCLEPPLLTKPQYWVCPEHEDADLPPPKGIKRPRTEKFDNGSPGFISSNQNGNLLRKDKSKITRRQQIHFLPGETLKLDFRPSAYPDDSNRRTHTTYSCDNDEEYDSSNKYSVCCHVIYLRG